MSKEGVLITGASGFIGANTFRKLKETEEVRNFSGDVMETTDWERNLREGEIVFLIAGLRTETDIDFAVNAYSIEKLFDVAIRLNKLPKRVILASSQAVYMGNEIPFNESQKPFPTTIYGQSKLLGEGIAEKRCEEFDIPLVILRYSTVLGKGVKEGSRMSGPLSAWTEASFADESIKVFQDGRQTRDYVHIDDVVSANLLAVRELESGIYNVGGGVAIELVELASWIKEAAHSNSRIVIMGGEPNESDPREMFSDTEKIKSYGWIPQRSAKEAVNEFVASNE